VLVLLTTVLVTGIFTTNVRTAFADSKLLRLDTKQHAICDTVGAASPISDSCNQQSTNGVNNGIPTAAKPTETTATLLIKKVCVGLGCTRGVGFNLTVFGNNPQPSSIHFTGAGGSQLVTLGTGAFTIVEFTGIPVDATFSGDCAGRSSTPFQALALGAISAGQHFTCTIMNTVS
jgi:hypothetical protein